VRLFKRAFSIVIAAWICETASAGDLNWQGQYRTEGVLVNGSEASPGRLEKSYLLHHLILRPTIVGADGWTIKSKLNIMNNGDYPNSQLGQFIGQGPRSGAINAYGANATDQYNSFAQNQRSDTIAINELYLKYQHEFGTFVVGRAPLDFGLGMTYNSGRDPWAHWLSNRDMVGYKMTFGNFFLMPMYGKVDEGSLDYEDDINEYMIHFQYDNPDNGLSMGVFFAHRVIARMGNDTPVVNGVIGGENAINDQQAGGSFRNANLFLRRELKDFTGGIELGFVEGKNVAKMVNAVDVQRSGFGVAGEFEYRPEESRNKFSLKTGLATGDNGNTRDRFEGYSFHRNYDVGELMFNHVLGRGDFLTTQYNRPRQTGLANKTNGSAFVDVESVSNVFYFSPAWERKVAEQWSLNTRFVYGSLNQGSWRDINRNQVESLSREYGFELDLGITYRPFENVMWRTTAALFWPGEAMGGGSNGFSKNLVDGAFTKLSIEF
jgi:hypothetical protein